MNSLDLGILEKVSQRCTKITARCPACAETGNDRQGNHLFINPVTGQFGCVACPGDRDHRRRIFQLVGIRQDIDPEAKREWSKRQAAIAAQELRRRNLSAALRASRASIISQHRWTEAEAQAESPEMRTAWLHDPRRFLATLFPRDALVWTGRVFESGQDGQCGRRRECRMKRAV